MLFLNGDFSLSRSIWNWTLLFFLTCFFYLPCFQRKWDSFSDNHFTKFKQQQQQQQNKNKALANAYSFLKIQARCRLLGAGGKAALLALDSVSITFLCLPSSQHLPQTLSVVHSFPDQCWPKSLEGRTGTFSWASRVQVGSPVCSGHW